MTLAETTIVKASRVYKDQTVNSAAETKVLLNKLRRISIYAKHQACWCSLARENCRIYAQSCTTRSMLFPYRQLILYLLISHFTDTRTNIISY